ncbi:HopJ type III effector protein [Pseudoalteromonas luteoviolacea]|uniref:HopJ type III effector protein n=1 Tax=Pseudoalteromonas luteoviolacea TaxID=43657 RepID=UPI001B38AD6E|nr:HopJ type III effector protein [Pseudoalteromonas luteoviolacea]MBQ4810076.1 HopJ type III effector protein [Pseudoalteromonas luteoviolacea]
MTHSPQTPESIEIFLNRVTTRGNTIEFEQTISLIDSHYVFNSCAFVNGEQHNEAGTNLGSCKILAFAKAHNLSEQATLHCFGHYYREDVLLNPNGTDHANIRNFIKFGWQGVSFSQQPLTQK